jgi:hypothetical protein
MRYKITLLIMTIVPIMATSIASCSSPNISPSPSTPMSPSPSTSPAQSPSPLITPSPISTGTGNLRVHLKDAGNNPLGGAKVVSEEQPAGQMKVTGMTGSDGNVTFNYIKAGKYKFYVNRFDYEQKNNIEMTVVAGQTTEITLELIKNPALSPTP